MPLSMLTSAMLMSLNLKAPAISTDEIMKFLESCIEPLAFCTGELAYEVRFIVSDILEEIMELLAPVSSIPTSFPLLVPPAVSVMPGTIYWLVKPLYISRSDLPVPLFSDNPHAPNISRIKSGIPV